MRHFLAFGLIALSACHPVRPSNAEPAACGPHVPASAQHPLAIRAAALAGDYDLIQVRTQPDGGMTTSGRLHLSPLDSLARAGAVGGAVRDLVGWLDLQQGDSAWRSNAASRDPQHPGVVLAGEHARIGVPGYLDGYTEHLTITAVSPDGFWGWWRGERGLSLSAEPAGGRVAPDPAGYFCALRITPSR
jgi:hypothetical protein